MRLAAFREALRDFESRTEHVLRAWGLTPQRYLLLVFVKGALDASERPTMSELRRRLKLSANSVTELVTRAEEAGLVVREPAEHDQRFVYVTLTDEGEQALAGALRETEEYRRDFAESFDTLATTFRAANRP
jgi:MarR family transcriptional regulator, organic hydroperoxide resistance regulator